MAITEICSSAVEIVDNSLTFINFCRYTLSLLFIEVIRGSNLSLGKCEDEWCDGPVMDWPASQDILPAFTICVLKLDPRFLQNH